MKPEIDPSGLMRWIIELSEITEVPPPAVTRVLFSKEDHAARNYVRQIAEALDLEWRVDACGNQFARWTGSNAALPAVATGSHIDAIPNAGAYDGVVGVLGSFEAIRALKAAGHQPIRSIEIITFTAEEPTRFGIGCLGSRLMSGNLSSEHAAALKDTGGKSLADWLTEQPWGGLLDSVRLEIGHYAAFIELHIEQGPLLEREGLDIGIVEKIAGPATLIARWTGNGGHAGAVLMPERCDALCAAAEMIVAVETAAKKTRSADTVATVGLCEVHPGAINSIPCDVRMGIDVRDTDIEARTQCIENIESAAHEIAERRNVELKLETLHAEPPAICDDQLVLPALESAQELGFTMRKMISRAYHDTLFMAELCPTTMLFIPCRNGWSHRPDEFSSPEQIERGTAVLANLLARAST